MTLSPVKKVFGIISYFPDNDSAYHIETRRERSRRFRELLFKLEELWPDVDIMIIAQNWQDFEMPEIKNKVKVLYFGKLGILGARRELRKRFLASEYDYLIMLDDDAIITSDNPQGYMDEIDNHPDGIGVIRKQQCPLQLFAISRAIYSQIDMPDIDAENGDGFEDDIFTAQCFAKFPDKAFMFPEGLVTETSFRYEGEGKCPSTWSKEKNYDWKYMRSNTKSIVASLTDTDAPADTPVNCGTESDIDLIITYVNGSDVNWVKDYIRVTKTHSPTAVRFRSWGTLKYLFRGIAKYMPFIRKIVLIVSRESQVPVWVNRKNVRVVYHDEFIPKKFLPTFNSCTIESFFWNIPDLADRVIYFNDDMFPINPMQESTFFTGNTPHLKFTELETYSARNIFRSQCRSSIELVAKALGKDIPPTGKIFRPYHISTPMVRSSMEEVGRMCEMRIFSSATSLRRGTNVNQYIYSYYQYYTGDYVDQVVSYRYLDAADKNMSEVIAEISNGKHQMICINDSDKIKDYNKTRNRLHECFEKKFPAMCKYEF